MFATLNNMLKNSSLKIILALAVGMTAGFMLGVSVVSRSQLNTDIQTIKPSQNSAEVKVSLMLDYGDGKVETILDLALSEKTSALDNLIAATKQKEIQLATKDYGNLGVLVMKIGDKENGQDQRYWQYWVNNQHANVGAGDYILRSGDVVEWKFLPSQEQ